MAGTGKRAGVLVLALASACAAPGSDVHLAPLYTRANTGDGVVETELLGGLSVHRREVSDGSLDRYTLGPLYGIEPNERGYVSHFLVPLGFAEERDDEGSTTLYPLFVWSSKRQTDGSTTSQLAALPGLLVEHNTESGTQFGIFPLWGKFEDFITYDELGFVLWPLYVYAEREERVSHHVIWPFFGWTHGGGERSWRVWPLYMHTEWEGRFDRWSVLWPLFHYQRNHLGGGGEQPETSFLFWPPYGYSARGTYRAHTTLWPFFGYSYDPRSDYWALDFPWPLVRLERGPHTYRTRFWPFYGYVKADGLEATSFLWPLIQFRKETYADSTRTSSWAIPIWQAWDAIEHETGKRSSWRKLFPLFQLERDGRWERGSFPTLDPFWRNELIDRHYAWIWKVWEWEQDERMRRERAWFGLYRRERGRGEDRRSITGLWSSRSYRDEAGREVDETSLLLGLLRWRVTEGEGFDMLAPAFPGPGWPAQDGRTSSEEHSSETSAPAAAGAPTHD